MNMTLLLPWFPIILAAGVAGRLVGRTRGLGVGFLCSLFYVALVQAAAGIRFWQDGWVLFGVVAGALAIFGMGGWSGQSGTGAESRSADSSGGSSAGSNAAAAHAPIRHSLSGSTKSDPCDAARIQTLVTRFDEWLEDHRERANPWPEFGEFVRRELHTCVGATHAKLFRLQNESAELVALNNSGSLSGPERISPKHGLAGRVLSSGRAYLAELDGAAEFKSSEESVAWCIPVLQGTRRLGLVVVGHLSHPPARGRELFRAVASLVSQFWSCLSEVLAGRAAVQRDPVSGLVTRPTFFRSAERAILDSYQAEEPVAVAVVALEGLRELNDMARWEAADALVDESGRALSAKLRAEDRLGRFDGSRFILLLRRVDADLASLIVGQIVSRLAAICSDADRWGSRVQVRCGVSCSGTERPGIHELVDRALKQGIRARKEGARVALDRASSPEPANVPG